MALNTGRPSQPVIPSVSKSVTGSRAAIEVRKKAPFAVGIVLWRDESDRVMATVVAKATYALDQGTSEIVEEPDPICHRDEYWEDGAAASLRFPSDLVPFKAAPELLIVGHVYASGNRPTHVTSARIAVLDIEKQVAAVAPRRFDRGGQLHISPPQSRFSLRYEFAPGGPQTQNPVGIDATALTPTGGYVLPQLTPPNLDVHPGTHVPLVGVGPVSHSWPARDGLLRPQDREWLLDPIRRPRPQGFDARYFCAAPEDQRSSEAFRPGERLILEGLHPAHARLVTNLAPIAPALRMVGARRKTPSFVADTLYIDTDRQIVTLAFRAVVPLDDEKLVLDLIAEGDLDQTSVLSVGVPNISAPVPNAVRGDDATTELDKSAFSDVAAIDLPFAPSSEPGRTRGPASVEGLPFRIASDSSPGAAPSPRSPSPRAPCPPPPSPPPSSPPPPLHPALLAPTVSGPPPSTPPLSVTVPRPSLVSMLPQEAFPEPEPPPATPAPRTTIGEVQSLLQARRGADRADEPQSTVAAQPEASRSGGKDPFRKAFGSGGGASAPPSPASVKGGPVNEPASIKAEPAPAGAASVAGAKAASDAAATTALVREMLEARRNPEKSDASSSATSADAPRRATRRAVVDLLACDPGVSNRLRRAKVYASILTDLAAPLGSLKIDEAAPEQDKSEKDRIDVLRVLSCGAPLDAGELHGALDGLLDNHLDFEIPLLLVEGEVKPTMDPVETLRVAASLAKPLSVTNKRVQAVLAAANDALAASGTLTSESALGLYKQLESATHELSLPPRFLADQVDRILLETRSFKKRTILGAPRIRGDMAIGKINMPIYLPESVASQLPLLPTVSVSALVELRPREDVSETNPDALVVLAMGRVLRARR